jgi:polyvinyl alcohol dehydrogenase (cytochrome)
MKNKFCFLLISLIFLSPAIFPEDELTGKQLTENNCVACHEDKSLNLASIETMALGTQRELVGVMTEGKMQEQAKHLSKVEINKIATFISSTEQTSLFKCQRQLAESDLRSGSNWTSKGNGSLNKRYQKNTNINSSNIKNLKLKWSFRLKGYDARSQPIAIGNLILAASKDTLYALDSNTGCSFWSFKSPSEFRVSPAYAKEAGSYVFAVDQELITYKVDLLEGKLVWKTQLPRESDWNLSSGSISIVDSHLIIPISTVETIAPLINPIYECCTTSGGIAKVDVQTGELIWYHRVEKPAEYVGKVRVIRTKKYAPSGSAVWNTPGIDLTRNLVFFGTGQSLQSPASEFSDAIIALDLNTGERAWSTQTLAGDAFNMACVLPIARQWGCPVENGPDFDFGASVIKSFTSNKEEIYLAGQKSGWAFGMKPSNGEIIWKNRIGMGGVLGGIHTGMATDDERLYVTNSDRDGSRKYDWDPKPGVYALNIDTGEIIWTFPLDDDCKKRNEVTDGNGNCFKGFSAPPSVGSDVVFAGALDGRLFGIEKKTGKYLWEFDTLQFFQTVDGTKAFGGSMDIAGPVITKDQLIVMSGYGTHGQFPGNVLLVFELEN